MKTLFYKSSVTVITFLIFFSLNIQAQHKAQSSGRMVICKQHIITGTINKAVPELENFAKII